MKISSSSFRPRELGADNSTEVACLEENNSRAKKESCTHTCICICICVRKIDCISRKLRRSNNYNILQLIAERRMENSVEMT